MIAGIKKENAPYSQMERRKINALIQKEYFSQKDEVRKLENEIREMEKEAEGKRKQLKHVE